MASESLRIDCAVGATGHEVDALCRWIGFQCEALIRLRAHDAAARYILSGYHEMRARDIHLLLHRYTLSALAGLQGGLLMSLLQGLMIGNRDAAAMLKRSYTLPHTYS